MNEPVLYRTLYDFEFSPRETSNLNSSEEDSYLPIPDFECFELRSLEQEEVISGNSIEIVKNDMQPSTFEPEEEVCVDFIDPLTLEFDEYENTLEFQALQEHDGDFFLDIEGYDTNEVITILKTIVNFHNKSHIHNFFLKNRSHYIY